MQALTFYLKALIFCVVEYVNCLIGFGYIQMTGLLLPICCAQPGHLCSHGFNNVCLFVCVCLYLVSLCFREEAFSRMFLAYRVMPGDSTCDKSLG